MSTPSSASDSETIRNASLLRFTQSVYRNRFTAWIVLVASLIVTLTVALYIVPGRDYINHNNYE